MNCYFSGMDCPDQKCFAAAVLNSLFAGAFAENYVR